MDPSTERALLQAIQDHPAIVSAAITGSGARRTEDRFSDLDMLLVMRDGPAVSDVRAWWPTALPMMLCAFHLTHYCTVLLADFQKVDLALFSAHDSTSRWVVPEYEVVKGDDAFAAELAQAAERTRVQRAAHLHPDISSDNVLLLLITARHRAGRGEFLSAHGFLAMACDMVIALEVRESGAGATADLLDPRRRLESLRPALAATIQECLFAPPREGIAGLARFLSQSPRAKWPENQAKVLEYLLGGGESLKGT